MDIANVTVGLSFLAGLASFLSPCVFSLVPAYVGYLGGRAAGGETADNNRFITFTHGLAFVLGFSVVFVTLGVASASLGRLLFDLREILEKVGGIVVIIFGLHMIGVFRIKFLEYDTRVQQVPDRKWGYLSSALMGVFFSAGWAPCVGPVLGAILTLALNGGSISTGATLLTAYSAGLAIPFLIAALGVGWVSLTLRKYGKVMHYVEIGMGVVLVIIGFMLFSGIFARIASLYPDVWIDFGI
jgi:cytochrome c-type biogenesis protein